MTKQKGTDMAQGSTLILRVAVVTIGGIVLLLTTLLSQGVFREWPTVFPHVANLRYIAVLILAITAMALMVALYQAMKLLGYIDKNIAFSQRSVTAFKNIKYAALIMSGALTLGMPFVFMIADKDDAPGLILVAMAIAGAPFVIAVAAAVAERLLQNVIDIKSENDLTV